MTNNETQPEPEDITDQPLARVTIEAWRAYAQTREDALSAFEHTGIDTIKDHPDYQYALGQLSVALDQIRAHQIDEAMAKPVQKD